MNAGSAAYLAAGFRTAIASRGRGFGQHPVDALAAPVLARVARVIGGPIEDVLLGNCLGPGGNIARVATLRAGLGAETPGVTIDRQCGAGLDAICQAVARVQAGDATRLIAGGAESASTAPVRIARATATAYERAPFAPPGWPDPDMGPAADAVARTYGITRARQDAWAARSHARACAAQRANVFAPEIVPVDGVTADDRPRSQIPFARFGPAFSVDGSVTAANSCGVSDGAAAVAVLADPGLVDPAVTGPVFRVCATAVTAGDPALPGIGAAAAIVRALDRASATVADLVAIEITEAFAAQVLAVCDMIGLPEGVVCGDGGALALGHPWGASGAILVVRLMHRMAAHSAAMPGHEGRARTARSLGLASCAIGGGQGLALVLERVL